MMTTKDDLGYEVIVPSFYLPWHVRGWQVLSLVTSSSHTMLRLSSLSQLISQSEWSKQSRLLV